MAGRPVLCVCVGVCYKLQRQQYNICSAQEIHVKRSRSVVTCLTFTVRFELQIARRAGRLLDFCSVFAVKFRCCRDCTWKQSQSFRRGVTLSVFVSKPLFFVINTKRCSEFI